MSRAFAIAFLLLGFSVPGFTQTNQSKLQWHDARQLTVEGKGWAATKEFYDRLPEEAEKNVRSPVWALSRDSAGMAVRFITDATEISVRWTLRKEALAMPHMPASGVSGVDLYVKEKKSWHWLAAARAEKYPQNEKVLVKNLKSGVREFILYLPLYNGVLDLAIGVPDGVTVSAAPVRERKPLVFYGTSIVQGGCAARPGMAYPAILGRMLDRPTINLGFSGNALAEPEIAMLLAQLDVAAYILDSLPNMQPEMVTQRMEPFIKILREKHPKTLIVLVENVEYPDGRFVEPRRLHYSDCNARLRSVFQKRVKAGDKNLFYIPAKNLFGKDSEATVDGSHPTDLGFMRMAEAMDPILRRVISKR